MIIIMSLVIHSKLDNPNAPITVNSNKSNTNKASFKLNPISLIDDKRTSARKQAMKLVGDAWKRDNEAYAGIQEMKDGKAVKVEEYLDLKNKIKYIEKQKDLLQEEYGISADSQEQQDLELLQKYQDNKTGASYDSFSNEERKRLKELAEMPLTDYQKKALELNGIKDSIDIELKQKESSIIAMTGSITNAEINMEKNQDMLKSQDAAEALMEAASKDIVEMLVDEAQKHIDSVQEEAEEKAEKIKEQKVEREERIEEAKERKEEQEQIIHDQIEADKLEAGNKVQEQSVDHLEEAQKVVEKLMNDNNMVNEDIKGIEIDLTF